MTRSIHERLVLGQLTEQQRDRLEEEAFVTDEGFALLKAAEADLLDAYVRDELSPEERTALEKGVLSTPGGRRRLGFADALKAAADRAPQASLGRVRSSVRGSWLRWATMAIAAAATVAVVVVTSGDGDGPVTVGHELRLEADALRDQRPGRETLTLEDAAEGVRLRLVMEPGETSALVDVRIVGANTTAAEFRNLTPDGSTLDVTVAAGVLSSRGRYVVEVSRDGQPLAFYSFDLR